MCKILKYCTLLTTVLAAVIISLISNNMKNKKLKLRPLCHKNEVSKNRWLKVKTFTLRTHAFKFAYACVPTKELHLTIFTDANASCFCFVIAGEGKAEWYDEKSRSNFQPVKRFNFSASTFQHVIDNMQYFHADVTSALLSNELYSIWPMGKLVNSSKFQANVIKLSASYGGL